MWLKGHSTHPIAIYCLSPSECWRQNCAAIVFLTTNYMFCFLYCELYWCLSELWHYLILLGVLEVFWFYATLIIFVDNNNINFSIIHQTVSMSLVFSHCWLCIGNTPAFSSSKISLRCCLAGKWVEEITTGSISVNTIFAEMEADGHGWQYITSSCHFHKFA